MSNVLSPSPLISELRAWPITRGSALLTWKINSDDWLSVTIVKTDGAGSREVLGNVSRSEQFTDKNVQMSVNRSIYYSLELQDRGVTFGPIELGEVRESPVAREHARRLRIQLKFCRPAALLSSKHIGTFCECYDTLTSRIAISNHEKCKGTGRLSGYADPRLIFISSSTETKVVKISDGGEMETTSKTAYTDNSILIKPRDFLITGGNRRFRVVDVMTIDFGTSPSKQTFTMQEVNPSDIEYDVAVPPNILREIQEGVSRPKVDVG